VGLVRLDQLESKEQRDRLALLELREQDQLVLQEYKEILARLGRKVFKASKELKVLLDQQE
jgi:hypothetical protein